MRAGPQAAVARRKAELRRVRRARASLVADCPLRNTVERNVRKAALRALGIVVGHRAELAGCDVEGQRDGARADLDAEVTGRRVGIVDLVPTVVIGDVRIVVFQAAHDRRNAIRVAHEHIRGGECVRDVDRDSPARHRASGQEVRPADDAAEDVPRAG